MAGDGYYRRGGGRIWQEKMARNGYYRRGGEVERYDRRRWRGWILWKEREGRIIPEMTTRGGALLIFW